MKLADSALLRMFGRSCSPLLAVLFFSSCYSSKGTPVIKSVAQKVQESAAPDHEGQWTSLDLIGGKWTFRRSHGWRQNGDSADELLCSPRKYVPWSIAIDEAHTLDPRTPKLRINLKVWMGASGEREDKLEPSALVGLMIGQQSKKTETAEQKSLKFPRREGGGYCIGLTADHKIQIIDFQRGKLLMEKERPPSEDGLGLGSIRGILKVSITQEKKGIHNLTVHVDGTELSVAIPSSRLTGALGLVSHPGSTEVDNAESVFSSYSVAENEEAGQGGEPDAGRAPE